MSSFNPKLPTHLIWEPLVTKDDVETVRAKVPGGWLVRVRWAESVSVTFLGDAAHEWDGGSLNAPKDMKEVWLTRHPGLLELRGLLAEAEGQLLESVKELNPRQDVSPTFYVGQRSRITERISMLREELVKEENRLTTLWEDQIKDQ